jgi:hypothetical protein
VIARRRLCKDRMREKEIRLFYMSLFCIPLFSI